MKGDKELPQHTNPMTYTERALQIATRQQKVAARDKTNAHSRNLTFTPGGYIYLSETRISFEAAVQHLAATLEQEDAPAPVTPKVKAAKAPAGPMTWEKLNAATQDFFFRLGEDILTCTQDAGMACAARLGHDIPKISLKDAPRLSNLKKAGLVETYNGEKVSQKHIRLTERGIAIWQSRV